MKTLTKIVLLCDKCSYGDMDSGGIYYTEKDIDPIVLYSGPFIKEQINMSDWCDILEKKIYCHTAFLSCGSLGNFTITLYPSKKCIFVSNITKGKKENKRIIFIEKNKKKFYIVKLDNEVKLEDEDEMSILEKWNCGLGEHIRISIYTKNYSKKIKTLLLCLKKIKIKIPKEIIFMIIDFVMK